MEKLNQIIAVEKGIKSTSMAEISEIYKNAQKAEIFNGFNKNYEKINEDGEDLPAESKKVLFTVSDLLARYKKSIVELGNITAKKDWANTSAKADLVVDGRILAAAVPVTYLLFLEKALTDARTFINALPVLDPSENWDYDNNAQLYKTEPQQTHRTKKVQKPIVMYDATEKHPAQVQLITEDSLVGYWKTTKLSGAISKPQKQAILDRVEVLLCAVKKAREEANSVELANTPRIMDSVVDYLFDSK